MWKYFSEPCIRGTQSKSVRGVSLSRGVTQGRHVASERREAGQDGRGESGGGGNNAAGGQNTRVQGDILVLRPRRRWDDNDFGVGPGYEDIRLESHRGRFASK